MLVKVYSPTGEAFEVSNLNANDLVQHSGWTRTPPKKPAAAVAKPQAVLTPVEDEEEETEVEEEVETEEEETPPPPPAEEPSTGLAAKKARVAAAQAKREAAERAAEAKEKGKAKKKPAKGEAAPKRLPGTKEDRRGFVDDPNLSPEENHQRWLNTINAETKVGGTDAGGDDF